MDKDELIDQIVIGRYYTYRTDFGINVYEAYFEDGERVTKKLASYRDEAEANAVVDTLRTLFREFFDDHFSIVTRVGSKKKPTLGVVKKHLEAQKKEPPPF